MELVYVFFQIARINLPRPFLLKKITRDVREYAKEQNVAEEKALVVGMAEKAKEFVATGSEVYQSSKKNKKLSKS